MPDISGSSGILSGIALVVTAGSTAYFTRKQNAAKARVEETTAAQQANDTALRSLEQSLREADKTNTNLRRRVIAAEQASENLYDRVEVLERKMREQAQIHLDEMAMMRQHADIEKTACQERVATLTRKIEQLGGQA